MRKYLLTTLAVILALNSQTFLFAKESSKKTGSNASFEQFLPSKNFTAQDFKNLLSDNSSIALEKIFLVPTKKTTDNTYIKTLLKTITIKPIKVFLQIQVQVLILI